MTKRNINFQNINCKRVMSLIDEALSISDISTIKFKIKHHIKECRKCNEYLNKTENLIHLISKIELKDTDRSFLNGLSLRVLDRVKSKDIPKEKVIARIFSKKETKIVCLRWAVPIAALILALTIIFKNPWTTSERKEERSFNRGLITENLEKEFFNFKGISKIRPDVADTQILKKKKVKIKRELPPLVVREDEREKDPLLTVNIPLLETGIANSILTQMTKNMEEEIYNIDETLYTKVSEEDSYKALSYSVLNVEDLSNMEELLIKNLSYDTGGYRVIGVIEKEFTNETSENI
ncbi:MAG: hypothetical protein ACUVWP_00245 [bacterium]